MEDRRNHRSEIAAAVVVCISLMTLSSRVARADSGGTPFDWPTTVTVDTNPDGVNINADGNGSVAGGSGTGTQASGGSGPHCYLKEIPGADMTEDLVNEYWARRMQYAPYYTICDGVIKGIVWIEIQLATPGSPGSSATNPRDIAMQIRDRMPVPHVNVDINPSRGLVGAESWFWVQGYNGRPLSHSTDAFGDLIEVQATVTRYDWSFGDGATYSSASLGQAYPHRSDVRHTYQRSSDGTTSGYPIDVTFVFSVRYRVGGGGWIDLPGISRVAHADYPVRESQAVIQQ